MQRSFHCVHDQSRRSSRPNIDEHSFHARVLPAMSFVSEMFVDDHYADDGITFATKAEALSYGESRAYAAYRAAPSDGPVNYRWTDGKLARAEPAYVPPHRR